VYQGGNSINGTVLGSGAKLGHWQEGMLDDVPAEPFGNNFFQELTNAFE